MANPGVPTFEQLRIFLAVVDAGSFAGAARRLNRAVSVISYGVTNLEAQLGLSLFEREGTKKPVLTVEGRALLAEVRTIGQGFDVLRAKVKGMLEGLEAEVNLAIDVMLPPRRVGAILRAFNAQYPTVSLRLHVEALGAITQFVLDKIAVVGLSGPIAMGVEGISSVVAGSLPMVPVASPDHPLARMEHIQPGAGRDHIQLVLTDRSRFTEGKDFSVSSPRTWRMADLGAKHSLLREGIGWGNMPLLVCGALIAVGAPSLASVDCSSPPGGVYRLKPGVYVSSGTDCGSPPNAAILTYDGRGLSGPHSHACRVRVLSRRGDRYTVEQSCVDAGAGAAPRRLQRQQITVLNALTFRQAINGRTTGYRYCPASMLPRDLQKFAR